MMVLNKNLVSLVSPSKRLYNWQKLLTTVFVLKKVEGSD